MAKLLDLRSKCPICQEELEGCLGKHIRDVHGEQAFNQAVLAAKQSGMPDSEIGARFGITFKQLERLITRVYGINVSSMPKTGQIKTWTPRDFRPETTTVWSYKQRGNWATHNASYRGNWSPYIPRNLILRYTSPDELVLDPFVGGGTTAIEAKLLGRKCIAVDINPACVDLTRRNLQFTPPSTLFGDLPVHEPVVEVGDARNLSWIDDNSIDLICAHPPYAGIIEYSPRIEGDLSQLGVEDFIQQIQHVADECYRVLKPGRHCAVLVGDTRKRKHVVPIGFRLIDVFLRAGFRLRELVIKRQHNCKTTGFWRERSIQHNFLLLAHEYLPIFEKPALAERLKKEPALYGLGLPHRQPLQAKPIEDIETTTVWVLPSESFQEHIHSNVVRRYGTDCLFIQHNASPNGAIGLNEYLHNVTSLVREWSTDRTIGHYVVIETRDVRADKYYLVPLAKMVVDALQNNDRLWLKEIVIAVPDAPLLPADEPADNLAIIHRYLLIYEVLR